MNKPSIPRILHLSTATTWRGGEQQLVYLYEELSLLGCSQAIVCQKDSALATHCQTNDFNFSTFSNSHGINFHAVKQLRRVIRKFSPDILHVHDSHSHNFAVLYSLFFKKIPIIVSRRVDFPIKNHYFSKFKYNNKYIKKIICVSNAIEKILWPSIIDKKKLVTIHDGVDLNKFANITIENNLREEYKINDNELIIGTVAALVDHKDLFTFIRMAKLLIEKNLPAKFIIVGEGELKKDLMQFVKNQDINNEVIFTGFRNDIKTILPQFDLFVLSSKEEGLGSSIMDAMICEVPVVATQAGGIPEIVKHSQTGLLAPIRNPNQLAKEVWNLIENPTLKKSLISAAKQSVKNFDKKRMAEKTKAIYLQIFDAEPLSSCAKAQDP